MHYDFKTKLNKLDSQQYRNLRIPEIDWVLNEAQELFVKIIAKPRQLSRFGFEANQRLIDDIRPIVSKEEKIEVKNNYIELPSDYWHFIRGRVLMSKNGCDNILGNFHVRQHDDSFEDSPFDKSSFEWRVVNGLFNEDGIQLFTDGTFDVDFFIMNYIRVLPYIHNAEDFINGTYNLPSGKVLTGVSNCVLPNHTHKEIVDIAVLIATGNIQAPDYQIKQNKLSLNNIN